MGEPPRTRFFLRSYILHIHEVWEVARGRRPFFGPSPPVPPRLADEEYAPRAQPVAESEESIRSRARAVKIAFGTYIVLMVAVTAVFVSWPHVSGTAN